MNIKLRLTILIFLQFFIWGSWLISTGGYLSSLGFNGIEIGSVFSTLGIASLIMPTLLGIIADRWVNAEKLLGICHLVGAVCLIAVSLVKPPELGMNFNDKNKIITIDKVEKNSVAANAGIISGDQIISIGSKPSPNDGLSINYVRHEILQSEGSEACKLIILRNNKEIVTELKMPKSFIKTTLLIFILMLIISMAYMPTISMNNTVSYKILDKSGFDIIKVFPPIRVWGTIGFICAMWFVDLTGFAASNIQYYVAAAAAIGMGIYCFSLPACPPVGSSKNSSIISTLGLDAFVLFRRQKMVIFFLFSMLLGAALQITNTFGGSFLGDFKSAYPDSFVVNHPLMMLSLSQISETLFILTIPYFLNKFGIKMVMIFSMVAWFFRFAFFAIGDPDPNGGLFFLILSMIVYGMAFDFFNISGSLFVEKEAPSAIRASAQGMFMMVTNGIGAIIGGIGSGWVVDYFSMNGNKDWTSIWFTFAGYALVIVIFFPLLFKYRHYPEDDLSTLASKH